MSFPTKKTAGLRDLLANPPQLQTQPASTPIHVEPEHRIKINVYGDEGVGKKALIYKFMHPEATEEEVQKHKPLERIQVGQIPVDDKNVSVTITNCEEKRFKTISDEWTRGAGAAFIVFDVTDADSFKKAKNFSQKQKEIAEKIPL